MHDVVVGQDVSDSELIQLLSCCLMLPLVHDPHILSSRRAAGQGHVLKAVVGQWEGGDVGTVGEEGLLWFVSPWGGTSMPRSANAVLAQAWKSSATLCLTRYVAMNVDVLGSSVYSASVNPSKCTVASPKS